MARITPIDKLARLDADIAALQARIDLKLDERRTLLTTLIVNGETLRDDVAEQIQSLSRANTMATTGRILTVAQVREIRRLHREGHSQGAIARQFGLSQPTIHKIVKHYTYQDVA